MRRLMVFMMPLLLSAAAVYGTTYYVDGNLPADCDGTAYHYDVATRARIPGSGQTAWKTIYKANQTLQAGDTVFIRGGTYVLTASHEEDAIAPLNSGSAGNLITYANYNNEDVVFHTGRYAINLNCSPPRGGSSNKRAFIKVSGSPGHPITFNNFDRQLWILATDHNEISYCHFLGRISGGGTPQGTYIYVNAAYNWIHHNAFKQWGSCEPYGTDEGAPFQMGINDADDHGTQFNLVENNDMSAGGHHVAWLNGTYNIYRNNYFHNEPWCPIGSPTFATRVLIQNGYAAGGDNVDGIHNLNEGNRIGYGGPKNKSEVGGNVAQMMGAWNIWRYNVWAQSYLSSIWLYCYKQYGEVTKYNHIYNNTFWKGGYGYYQDYYDPRATAPTNSWSRSFHHPVNIADDVTVAGNTFKNNIFHQNNTNGTYALGGYHDFVTSGNDYYNSAGPGRQNIFNNWTDDMGDPGFIDISAAADPSIDPAKLWNFNLQSSSAAIDGGAFLATANGAGNHSTSLVLNTEPKSPYLASLFFYDAGNIKSIWPNANVNSDWIAIGSVSNTVQISSIDYKTNTITLSAPITWTDDAPVWLYKKSDGNIVLHGAAPDYGAYEYTPAIYITSPVGGETWIQGTSHAITWSSSGVTEPVRIELLKSGVLNQVIAENQAVANGSYAWNIPANQVIGDDYSIKLTAGAYESTSGNFSIAAPGAPVVTTNPATAVTQTSAVLHGTVHPMGYQTAYRFEYGLTTAYGLTTPDATLNADADQTIVQAALAGLTAGTVYHFRLVAENGAGTNEGNDLTFTTSSSGGGGGSSGDSGGGGGGGGGCFIASARSLSPWFMLLGLFAGWLIRARRRAKRLQGIL